MRKGWKLSSLIVIVLLTLVTLSFKNTVSKESGSAAGKKVIVKSVDSATISPREIFNEYVLSVYNRSGLAASGLDYQVFLKGMTGYHNLKDLNVLPGTKEILSVVDFSKPSTEKRLWVIDLKAQKVLFNTFVAHGQGSGEAVAKKFSNVINSFQSSVGFYSTAEVYTGKHGRSLKLDGLDADLNGMARERAIVVHGADYVSQDFINRTGRLGRSQGCPALPMDLFADVINNIEGNTLLFINGEGVDTSDLLKGVDHTDSKNEA
ncbi:murein L,D-transpeptidase catalytic domain family protein [Daejeonella sp. JGW-45]|uniref:murein L,D-transpeptidase catalytic domain family protein n=3 Tax=unclassified Daejeonella TaxID=2805396 RepID=UPI0023ED37FB|nr:murein L,D-transpeptidase catalytic domain family protein [Daejeonella sp. JGW-45]